jgi:ubiquinone/menaquinone biosynthesis C-methylase UbiE
MAAAHPCLIYAAQDVGVDRVELAARAPATRAGAPDPGCRGAARDGTPWDGRVDAWEGVARTPGFIELRERITRLASPLPQDCVLDLGAGTGLLTLALAPRVRTVEAVDASPPMLARLREHAEAARYRNVTTTVADLRSLPLPDCAYTLVVSNYAFHHLDHAGKALALSEARRVLRPGGRLVIGDMMFRLSLRRRDRRLVAGKVIAIARRGPAGAVRLARNAARLGMGRWEHPESPESWADLLAERHFRDISILLLAHEGGIATAHRPPVRLTSQP